MTYLNNWIPTKTLDEMSKINYDVLIVGTGPAEGQLCIGSANCGRIKALKR